MEEKDTLEDVTELNNKIFELIYEKKRNFTPRGVAYVLASQLATVIINNTEDGYDNKEGLVGVVSSVYDVIKERIKKKG